MPGLVMAVLQSFAQSISFTPVKAPQNEQFNWITSMSQDPEGFLWIATNNGVFKYDGRQFTSYYHEDGNSNSIAQNWVESVLADDDGIVWLGTFGSGLDRFDPARGTVTHYRHHPNDADGLSNDTITVITKDRQGTFWLGTNHGVERFDPKTNTFHHYAHSNKDPGSISNNQVRVIYEDKQGTLWVGCGSAYYYETKQGEGGLNKLDKKTGKFTHFLHDPKDPNSLIDNRVRAIFEDSRGTFWVGTAGDGLYTMDRARGTFKHYPYDPAQPGKLSRPPIKNDYTGAIDHITFITEDVTGKIWIGSFENGINVYDPATKKITWYNAAAKSKTGLLTNYLWCAYKTKEGILWISDWIVNLYKVIPYPVNVPHTHLGTRIYDACEDSLRNLWLATSDSLILRSREGEIKYYPIDKKIFPGKNRILYLEKDSRNNRLWLSTLNGLFSFDISTKTFTRYHHQTANDNSLVCDTVLVTLQLPGRLWIGTHRGLDLMNIEANKFMHFSNKNGDTSSISNNNIRSVYSDNSHHLWVGTSTGINLYNEQTGRFKRYLEGYQISTIFQDNTNDLWVGTYNNGLFKYDKKENNFFFFRDPSGVIKASTSIYGITGDSENNLWLNTPAGIVKFNLRSKETIVFDKNRGVDGNVTTNFILTRKNREILFGDSSGYFTINPQSLLHDLPANNLSINNFYLSNRLVVPAPGGVLTTPVFRTAKINLAHDQNTFSFNFSGIDYVNYGEDDKLYYKLENYDGVWRKAGDDQTAYYFNVAPGKYIFKVKAANSNGLWTEKQLIVIIALPWWQRWWAYTLFILLAAGGVWAFVNYRARKLLKENQLLEQKIRIRTKQLTAANHELQEQREEIVSQRDNLESTLKELKNAQIQLIQSEKMASLGELTTGIAHEIQNPLNFVNNFSDLNQEMLDELYEELDSGGIEEAKAIAADIRKNEEKINHHGKRADSIVKGMLEHSRATTGQKELTDINKLADEYLRLAYQGLMVKDKNFNAALITHFDANLPSVTVIPQDIGRVLLNLFNNAFYAIRQRQKNNEPDFKPTIEVSTSLEDKTIIIVVTDNGPGIPENIKDKIMQPFFTTKPTGEGTGLGLYLAYDIVVKGHGGKIQVESKELQYTTFTVSIPLN